ncbi:MAG TPA: GAF domain-containing protein [Pseudolabrys sp.]|nr:GAF domain-containing protein [Pseudolabrys sp.]
MKRRRAGPVKSRVRKPAAPHRSSTALKDKAADLARELKEAREQLTATSEMLKVISSSPGNLEPVFKAILENATRICEARFGNLNLYDGKVFRRVAIHNPTPQFAMRLGEVIHPHPESGFGYVARTRQIAHIDDVRTRPPYLEGDEANVKFVDLTGARTVLAVPMLKGNELIGLIAIFRQEVRPFTDKQIELMKTFAAQAVIAIENTRLLNELRQRTDDLTESLEQQTASAEVLKIISASPGELEPVFQEILKSAVRICGAKFGNLWLREGDCLRIGAMHRVPRAYADFVRGLGLFHPDPRVGPGAIIRTKRSFHTLDLGAVPTYGDKTREALVKLTRARTLIGVPMLKDGEVIGIIGIYREEVRPFTDRQVQLVQNFADQAVIAIENARLLNELRQRTDDLSESLEQQTATSEVLGIISRSPGELAPVFNGMLENAVRICAAKFGSLVLFEGDAYRRAALCNAPAEFLEQQAKDPVLPLSTSRFLAHMAATKEVVQVADMLAEWPEEAIVKFGRARTVLSVPMLRNERTVGVFTIYRQEVRPFTGKQIELVKNFAAQAVIAIENTRLLNELRQRTDDLSESLEQQTATSEVLKIISSSRGELTPVFDAMLANATRVCEARIGVLYLRDGDDLRAAAATRDAPPAYVEARMRAERGKDFPLDGPVRRAAATKQVAHVTDIRELQSYRDGHPLSVTSVELGKFRTVLGVPLLKDDELIGVITMNRQEVRPFTDKQIDLVKNFAAQAVIAIENTRLLNELRESLQQQTATADVLKVISSSQGNIEPVFDSILVNATRICEASFANLVLLEDGELRLRARHGAPAAFADAVQLGAAVPRRTPVARVIETAQLVHIADLQADEAYRNIRLATLAGARTTLGVPMFRDGQIIGAILIYRQEVREFNDKQIELVRNFAAQAVIAIENARLLNELRESLQQQTATADVLRVISSSPGTLDPVFGTLLAKATDLCEASYGTLWLCDGDGFRAGAMHGDLPPAWHEQWRSGALYRPGKGVGLARAAEGRQPIQVADMREDPSYLQGDPLPVSGVDVAGIRTLLVVPMFRESELVGAIAIYRTEVLPFTEKQIELVKNFAAQAVIAIENARLLNELRESLQQQTATADVLRVISSSPGELEPVFDAILKNAMDICRARFGQTFLYQDGNVSRVAQINVPEPLVKWDDQWGLQPPVPGGPLERVMRSRQVVHIADISSELSEHPAGKYGGAKTLLAVPMIREDVLVGALVIYRQEVLLFTDKQIELVRNFAAQAVIAIENARLLNELRQRTDDLSESLEQQTATSEVLKIVSSSPGELKPVFQAMLEQATRICDAKFGIVLRYEGGLFHPVASLDLPPALADFMARQGAFAPQPGQLFGRLCESKTVIDVVDRGTDPDPSPSFRYGGARSSIAVPMLKDDELVGALFIFRTEVRPFTGKQIELVKNFAAQAVIAIENTRLLNELRESLQQQTATAEVLKVISSSPGNLEPVFNAMLENAVRICEARFGVMHRFAGEEFYSVAHLNLPGPLVEFLRTRGQRKAIPGSDMDKLYKSKQVVHTSDMLAVRVPSPPATLAGARTQLAVPMLMEGELVGAIVIYRTEVRPFTDKQIELVQNFAAQAVIAIENVRLLSELRESLQQQTATSDVLKVISRSTFDLQTVLDTLVQSAARLCEADLAAITRLQGTVYRHVASYGMAPEAHEAMTHVSIALDRSSVTGRTALEKKIVHVLDAEADPEFNFSEAIQRVKFRTILGVPLLRQGVPIGVIVLMRRTVQSFTDKQIELVNTFADQAVIAIENVRLFDELRESLQQQTATSDVLKVISRSTFDLQTVLQTLVESAATLCDADRTIITRQKDGVFYRAESHGFSREFIDHVSSIPIAAERGSAFGRALLEKRAVHIPDVLNDPDYTLQEGQRLGDYRTVLAVPMLREDVVTGVLSLTRSEVRPFTKRQIELATTFADQAAIAIENVRLFDAVQGRTRELAKSLEDLRTTQDRLVQTQKLASLGQLTAGIAHEIKNPLNFVNNFSTVSSELLDELQDTLKGLAVDNEMRGQIDELTAMLRGNLDKVVQHGKRADSIVKNMLLHSREGSGEHRVVDINALVEESLNLAYHGKRAETQGFNVTLERSLDPDAGEADIFPQDITRVLLNLISNGFYAASRRKTQGGDGFEPVLAAATRSLGDRVEIRIRDNGTGIPPAVREKMFNPFFTTKPAGEGTGLGLSISHDIVVKQHGGAIEVDTEPDAFTEIRIILPRKGVFGG